tara:strand:+ start:2099 stop:2461 length:363 start_codon:yes stop_codon:yes gene_type:complete
MATKSLIPNQNAYMNITQRHIEDLDRLGVILRTTFSEKSNYNNLTKIARIPEAQLDKLLKLVDVTTYRDGTMKVGRFNISNAMRGRPGIKGEIFSIVPASRRAGKTRRRRRKKSKGTRRR